MLFECGQCAAMLDRHLLSDLARVRIDAAVDIFPDLALELGLIGGLLQHIGIGCLHAGKTPGDMSIW